MIEQRIRETRDKAQRALLEAREHGKQIGELEAAGTAVPSELMEKFNRAEADYHAQDKIVLRLEREKNLEAAGRVYTDPAPSNVQHRAPAPGAPETAERKEKKKEVLQRAFMAYVRQGEQAAAFMLHEHFADIGPTEQFMHLGTSGPEGGFTVPEDFRAELIKDIAGRSVFRQIARTVPTSRDVLVFPSIVPHATDPNNYSSGFAGQFRVQGYVSGGTAPTVQTQPKFSQERIPVHSWQPDAVELSPELLDDSAVPLESVLAELIAETRAMDEDNYFINGDGVQKPLGILSALTAIPTVASGNASLVTYGGMVDLFTNLAGQYAENGTFLMRRLSLGALLKLADNQAYPIIPPNSLPNTLWGRPMRYSEFMPAIAADSKPVIFGDFKHYIIADRQDMRLQRLVERFAPNVGFLPHARVGGQTVRKNAFRALVVSAS